MDRYEIIKQLIRKTIDLGDRKYGSNTPENDNYRAGLESIERAYYKKPKLWQQKLEQVLEEEPA